MNLTFWDWVILLALFWAGAIGYNYLDWQWQLAYDKAMFGEVDTK